MDRAKYSKLQNKWRCYYDKGQHDIFNTSSEEESDETPPTPMEENSVATSTTDATVTSEPTGLQAEEHEEEQPPDAPELQVPDEIEESREEHVPVNFTLDEPGMGNGLKLELAKLQKLKFEKSLKCMAAQQLEYRQRLIRQLNLLLTHNPIGDFDREVYSLEDLTGPIGPKVSERLKKKFAAKVKFDEYHGEMENNMQQDMVEMQNPDEVEDENTEGQEDQQCHNVTSLFKRPSALYQYNMVRRLETILEEPESTSEEQGQSDIDQQLDTEDDVSEDNVDGDTESDISLNEDFEELERIITEFRFRARGRRAALRRQRRFNNLIITVLVSIAISVRFMGGDLVDELLNYCTYVDSTIIICLFSAVLCICKIYQSIAYADIDDEDEYSESEASGDGPSDMDMDDEDPEPNGSSAAE
ncbi:PREDICTED: uncharacterized protein LOC106126138 [Papilio xuthus]|uniref:Uncharacterized protein LOC106126138 n=1 Tax=Papilio xuthus TaxID=66420 RepID=A0AAJ6ZU40_PAPXU|nr:PREDICTED: uncharacterized protein LOC106126138 [Papilio xuthus]